VWLTRPAYRRLSPAARGALLHTILAAGNTSPEATWKDPAELAELLEFDGFAAEALAELVAQGWLAETDEGLVMPGWDEIQWPASEAIRREYERSRKAAWRSSKRDPLSKNSLPSQDITRQDITESRFVPDSPGQKRRSHQVKDDLPLKEGAKGPEPDCYICGARADGPDSRVTHYRDRPWMIHNACLPVAS
jgi:hypothetical protein